jgi:hypothetical protein
MAGVCVGRRRAGRWAALMRAWALGFSFAVGLGGCWDWSKFHLGAAEDLAAPADAALRDSGAADLADSGAPVADSSAPDLRAPACRLGGSNFGNCVFAP